eukprot:g35978.t1
MVPASCLCYLPSELVPLVRASASPSGAHTHAAADCKLCKYPATATPSIVWLQGARPVPTRDPSNPNDHSFGSVFSSAFVQLPWIQEKNSDKKEEDGMTGSNDKCFRQPGQERGNAEEAAHSPGSEEDDEDGEEGEVQDEQSRENGKVAPSSPSSVVSDSNNQDREQTIAELGQVQGNLEETRTRKRKWYLSPAITASSVFSYSKGQGRHQEAAEPPQKHKLAEKSPARQSFPTDLFDL